jgi:hypothetical protein
MSASQMLSQLFVVQRLWLFILEIGESPTGILVCFVFEKVIFIFRPVPSLFAFLPPQCKDVFSSLEQAFV